MYACMHLCMYVCLYVCISVVTIPDFAMRYLGHDAIRIAILVSQVNQCLYLQKFYEAWQCNIYIYIGALVATSKYS